MSNVWQLLLEQAESRFAPVMACDDRESAHWSATPIAQEACNVPEDMLGVLLICCPELASVEPWQWKNIVAHREYGPLTPAEFFRHNICNFIERHLERQWDRAHGYTPLPRITEQEETA